VTCDTLGLYARSVAGRELLASVFQPAADEPSSFSLKGVRVAFCKTQMWPKAGAGTKAAWEKAKGLLEGEGVVVEELELPERFARITEWLRDVLAGERTSFWAVSLASMLVDGKLTEADYLIGKEKMHKNFTCHVGNKTLTRTAQLEAYDRCAALRPVWDGIASQYDAVITPSVVDEGPLGINNTGDAVSSPSHQSLCLRKLG